eukprot:scaffold26569_cov107-Isochrysis_galbana.AAC.2
MANPPPPPPASADSLRRRAAPQPASHPRRYPLPRSSGTELGSRASPRRRSSPPQLAQGDCGRSQCIAPSRAAQTTSSPDRSRPSLFRARRKPARRAEGRLTAPYEWWAEPRLRLPPGRRAWESDSPRSACPAACPCTARLPADARRAPREKLPGAVPAAVL